MPKIAAGAKASTLAFRSESGKQWRAPRRAGGSAPGTPGLAGRQGCRAAGARFAALPFPAPLPRSLGALRGVKVLPPTLRASLVRAGPCEGP